MGHESLCVSQKMRSRHSSGSTLPCIRLGSGVFKMFRALVSWQTWHQPLSTTCCGGQKLCSSSYQSLGSIRLGCSAIGLPRWSSVPAIDTLTPGSPSEGATYRLWLCETVGPTGCLPPYSFPGSTPNGLVAHPGGVSLAMSA